MGDIAEFAEETVDELDETLKDVRIPRATSARARCAATTSSRTARATPAGRARIPGCGFVIWKAKAGKQLPLAVARELIKTGRTEQAGHRLQGRSGRASAPGSR